MFVRYPSKYVYFASTSTVDPHPPTDIDFMHILAVTVDDLLLAVDALDGEAGAVTLSVLPVPE